MTRVWARTNGYDLNGCMAEHGERRGPPRKVDATSTRLLFEDVPPPWCACRCFCHHERKGFVTIVCGRAAAWELRPPVGDNLSGSIWSCDQCVFQCE